MSKGSRKEQICLAASGESAAGQGALADPSAETSLPGAAVTHLWLWVSASCRAPACPAASCQQLEWHEGFAGQARKASGLPLLAGCACCWENMALLGGAGPLGGALLAAPAPVLLPLRSQANGRVMRVVLLRSLTLFISSAGCRVPRSSVPSVTPSRLLETFGASTYEGPSGRDPATWLSSSHQGGEERQQQKKDVLKFKEKTNQRLQTWT